MKIIGKTLLYFLTVLLGVLGCAGVLRFVEVMLFVAEPERSPFVGLLTGIAFLYLARKCYLKASGKNDLPEEAAPQE